MTVSPLDLLAEATFPQALWAHRPAVRRFLGGRLRSSVLAEEATQETMVRAFLRRETLRDPSRLAPWLFGIARRVLAEERRRTRRAEARCLPETALLALPSPLDQEAELAARQMDRALALEIDALGPERRSALLLRVDQELGYAEIAAELGWSVPKVKNELHRTRRVLKAALALVLGLLPLLFLPKTERPLEAAAGLACWLPVAGPSCEALPLACGSAEEPSPDLWCE